MSKKKRAFQLPEKKLKQIYDLMVQGRALEERLILMYKQNDGYFWIGGPGEEAFNVPLGLQVYRGEGLDFDFLHLHYRSSAILLTMGEEPVAFFRQMKNVQTDPYSRGRNFCNHPAIRKWNVVPTHSTIEPQYLIALGTALAQKRHGGKGITIVNGGDAGTAEGDFASSLIWSSRPGEELPMLILVMNNRWGISTAYETQHGEKRISDRGKAFGMRTAFVNGFDVEASYFAIKEAMDYVRKERKPFLLEASVSRLHGHSSASGANWAEGETDPVHAFERTLLKEGILSKQEAKHTWDKYQEEFLKLHQQVKKEPAPDPKTIYDFTYAQQKGRYW